MSAEDEVREASKRFYEALNKVINGDASAMEHVWWHDEEVSSGHPMGTWVLGWAALWVTWIEFAKAIPEGTIELANLQVRVHGDVGYSFGTEITALTIMGKHVAFNGQATNIYRRKNGEWRVVHHHADKAPSFEQAV